MASVARANGTAVALSRQANPVASRSTIRATEVARCLGVIQRAIQETGWNCEAVAAEMGIDKSYLSRLLSGEKTLTFAHLLDLPDDAEAAYYTLRLREMGRIVVEPVEPEAAIECLVRGLVGVLTERKRMAKAAL